jgi:hypothetical protein
MIDWHRTFQKFVNLQQMLDEFYHPTKGFFFLCIRICLLVSETVVLRLNCIICKVLAINKIRNKNIHANLLLVSA